MHLIISTSIGMIIFLIGLGILGYACFNNYRTNLNLELEKNNSLVDGSKTKNSVKEEQEKLKEKMLIIEKNLNDFSSSNMKFKELIYSYLDSFGLIHEFVNDPNTEESIGDEKSLKRIKLINKRIINFFNSRGYEIIYPKLGDEFNHELMEVVHSGAKGKSIFLTDRPGLHSQKNNILFKAKVILN